MGSLARLGTSIRFANAMLIRSPLAPATKTIVRTPGDAITVARDLELNRWGPTYPNAFPGATGGQNDSSTAWLLLAIPPGLTTSVIIERTQFPPRARLYKALDSLPAPPIEVETYAVPTLDKTFGTILDVNDGVITSGAGQVENSQDPSSYNMILTPPPFCIVVNPGTTRRFLSVGIAVPSDRCEFAIGSSSGASMAPFLPIDDPAVPAQKLLGLPDYSVAPRALPPIVGAALDDSSKALNDSFLRSMRPHNASSRRYEVGLPADPQIDQKLIDALFALPLPVLSTIQFAVVYPVMDTNNPFFFLQNIPQPNVQIEAYIGDDLSEDFIFLRNSRRGVNI